MIRIIARSFKDRTNPSIYQDLAKTEKSLNLLHQSLTNPKGRRRKREELEKKINTITKGQYLKDILKWKLIEIGYRKY